MLSIVALAALAPLALAQTTTNSQETILGVYIFHRHGDRTPKSLAPANLTDLGYWQVHTSGSYYRNRYISSSAGSKIHDINTDLVKQSQIAVSAPDDTVLQNSATGFLQGLYPPVGSTLGTQTLANGTNVTRPLDGYQLIPVDVVQSGSGSEDNSWLQSTSNCGAATVSSNDYFTSEEYQTLLERTRDFYMRLKPAIETVFTDEQMNFKNAYTIYDYLNVASIHNSTLDRTLISDDVLFQLRTLADQHEWGLAYNSSSSSDNARAIAGKTLAAQITQFLNNTIVTKGKTKIGIQFGAYATFASFFGLADLQSQSVNFTGVADYTSAMTFELVTNSSVSSSSSSSSYPAEEDISVRFLFHNGTTMPGSEPLTYPLFGRTSQATIPWTEFVSEMRKFSIGDARDWCMACGNTTGACAAYAVEDAPSNGGETSGSDSKGNGLSPAVNGVIGAMVTLAVILGLEALILAIGGFRVVSKRKLAGAGNVRGADEMTKA